MTTDEANELILELEDKVDTLENKLSDMTDERDIALTHEPMVKECLVECLDTLTDLKAFHEEVDTPLHSTVEKIQACLALCVTPEKKSNGNIIQ